MVKCLNQDDGYVSILCLAALVGTLASLATVVINKRFATIIFRYKGYPAWLAQSY